ncbi:MAG: hypothetical protein PVSMB7_25850 [Chloroflexota bacterium]
MGIFSPLTTAAVSPPLMTAVGGMPCVGTACPVGTAAALCAVAVAFDVDEALLPQPATTKRAPPRGSQARRDGKKDTRSPSTCNGYVKKSPGASPRDPEAY